MSVSPQDLAIIAGYTRARRVARHGRVPAQQKLVNSAPATKPLSLSATSAGRAPGCPSAARYP